MGESAYSLVMTAIADAGDRQMLEDGLNAYNRATSPYFAALAEPADKQLPLDVFVRDAAGGICGGLAGTTYWGWLTMRLLWLAEPLRGQGYGTRLVQLAEDEAQQRGCTSSRVTTYSFQARGFYERLGYRVVGQLDGFPPGGARYTLRKDFVGGG